jgi:hypothetical protein
VTSTLIGARTIEQLRSNLASLEITLAREQLAALNEPSTPTLVQHSFDIPSCRGYELVARRRYGRPAGARIRHWVVHVGGRARNVPIEGHGT